MQKHKEGNRLKAASNPPAETQDTSLPGVVTPGPSTASLGCWGAGPQQDAMRSRADTLPQNAQSSWDTYDNMGHFW